MKSSLIIALVILTLASCKKSSTNTVSTKDTSGIVGNWKWIASDFDAAPSDSNPLTPKYAGYQKILSFNTDNSYILTKNNVIIDSGTYTHGHANYVDSFFNERFIYDSILYYHKGVRSRDIDYYRIYADTLLFDPSMIHILGASTTFWKKQ